MEDVSYFAAGPSSAATSEEARHALMRVVAAIVKGQGYDGIESSAMAHILNSLESLMFSLPMHAHELAAVANRRVPSTRDFYIAMLHSGPRLSQADLEQYLRDADLDDLEWTPAVSGMHAEPEWQDPFHGCLPSESEDDSAVEESAKEDGVVATRSKVAASGVPIRRRRRKRFRPEMAELPSHLPSLPPKHTWLYSPSYPAHSVTLQPPLAFLDLKVSSNRLMEVSLRGLIRATDAAALRSQAQHTVAPGGGQGEAASLEPDVFRSTSSRFATDDRPEMSPSGETMPRAMRVSTPTDVGEEEGNRTRMNNGRSLSLRLRTPSTPQSLANIAVADAREGQPPLKRPSSIIAHRPSMSLMGPQSAVLPSFATHNRRSTYSTGPWSASSGQTQFNWNAASPLPTEMMSPLATPLTAGMNYPYPPTPTEVQAREILSRGAGQHNLSDTASTTIGLPPTVNYKRTWYKRSSRRAEEPSTGQKRIKS